MKQIQSVINLKHLARLSAGLCMAAFFLTASLPAIASTADNYSGLVKCSGVVENSGEVACSFNTFVSSIVAVINWLFFISVPVAVALFAYAGILHMSGKEDNKKKSKTIFQNVAIGFILMIVAFTVVHTLIGWLVDPNFGAETLLGQ